MKIIVGGKNDKLLISGLQSETNSFHQICAKKNRRIRGIPSAPCYSYDFNIHATKTTLQSIKGLRYHWYRTLTLYWKI